MSIVSIILAIVVIGIAVAIIAAGVKVVPQSETRVIERLGRFHAVLPPGLNFIIPFVDRPKTIYTRYVTVGVGGRHMVRMTTTPVIDLREQVYDFPSQQVITRDNVTTEINALLYFQITDPKKAVYEIDNLPNAIEKLTQTSLRNVIGELELDETLTSRDTINTRLQSILDDATNKWGVKVNRVELQDITPPESVRVAMEKQMQAERNRRAEILNAEGEKQSLILRSEGQKASRINEAEAVKQAESTTRRRRGALDCAQRAGRGRRDTPGCRGSRSHQHRPRHVHARDEIYRDTQRDDSRQRQQDCLHPL